VGGVGGRPESAPFRAAGGSSGVGSGLLKTDSASSSAGKASCTRGAAVAEKWRFSSLRRGTCRVGGGLLKCASSSAYGSGCRCAMLVVGRRLVLPRYEGAITGRADWRRERVRRRVGFEVASGADVGVDVDVDVDVASRVEFTGDAGSLPRSAGQQQCQASSSQWPSSRGAVQMAAAASRACVRHGDGEGN
jgi:hypothetical protein